MEQYFYYIIASAIILLGCIIFYFSMNSTNYRKNIPKTADAIKEYKEVRNKITLSHVEDDEEETNEEETDEEDEPGSLIVNIFAGLIGLGVTLFVGYTVLNSVQASMGSQLNSTNTAMDSTISSTFPVLVLVSVIGLVFATIQVFGLVGGGKD